VPWPEEEAKTDAEELFKAWLEERGGATPREVREAISQVRRFIEAHGDSRFDDITIPDPDRRPVINRAGYRRGEGEDRRWLVLPEVFVKEICAGFNATEVAKILADKGMLVPGNDGKFSRSERVRGKKQRVYVLTPAVFEGWDEEDE
jgi:uncharacterized protein (DUF927 family)